MSNVFGNPITDASLTSSDRARMALNLQTTNMRDTQGRAYVESLKQQSGTGVSTLCLIYNATGNTLTISSYKDWYGQIGPAPYPQRIQNGQWSAFLHVKGSSPETGSCSAAVFRGKAGNEADCDYMMAWSNPWSTTTYGNSVYVGARSPDYFTNNWDVIRGYLNDARYNYSDTWQGCLTTIGIGSATTPEVEAIFTLEDAAE